MKDTEKELGSPIALFSEVDVIDYEEDDAVGIHPKKKARPSVTGGQRTVQQVKPQLMHSAEAQPQAKPQTPAPRSAKPQPAQPKPASVQTTSPQTSQARPAQARPAQARPNAPAASRPANTARPAQAKPAASPATNKAPAPRPTASRPQGEGAVSPNGAVRPQNGASRPVANAARPARPATSATKPQSDAAKVPASRPAEAKPQAQPRSAQPQTESTAPANPTPAKSAATAVADSLTSAQPAATAERPSPERLAPERPATRPITTIRSIPRPAEPEEDDDILTAPRRSEKALSPKARSRTKRKITAGCVVRRSLLVFFTVIFFAVGVLLALCNTLANGPSQTARDKAVMSALQASATKWVPGLFLSDEVVEQIKADSTVVITDVKPITDISSGDASGEEAEDRWANAIDGMIYENVNGSTFKGYVLLIKDPSRVSVGVSSDNFETATIGMRIFELADKYDALAAINAGEFRDDGGMGTGYAPMGLTYSDGECVWNDGLKRTFMGFDENDRLFVGEGTTYAEAEELGMRDAVSFQTGNVLITNDGENVTYYYADSNTGVAQRTAIGQCADGTVIFLVTDGRTASSMGATRNEIIDTLVSYGAVTAGMLDGGSSSMLYYRDYYTKYNIDESLLDEYQLMGLVNKYKAFTSPRYIPTYFIVK